MALALVQLWPCGDQIANCNKLHMAPLESLLFCESSLEASTPLMTPSPTGASLFGESRRCKGLYSGEAEWQRRL